MIENKITINDWKEYFPAGKQPRQIQITAINFALNQYFNNQKKYVIIQAPVGSGKSFIGTTIANFINGVDSQLKSYILTTQIILQDQYKKQFPEYINISSRRNYPCLKHKQNNCAEINQLHKHSTLFPKCQTCYYNQLKKEFIQKNLSITNTSFFISNVMYNPTFIQHRNLLIIDQAHNTQNQIIKQVGLQIDYYKLNKMFGFKSQMWIKPHQNVKQWLDKFLVEWIVPKMNNLNKLMKKQKTSLNKFSILSISSKYTFIQIMHKQLISILTNFQNTKWVLDNKKKNRIISITPIYGKDYANQLLFNSADRVLLMSGTILNKQVFCNSLNIPLKQCGFISLDSTFPVQNRQIFLINAGSMSKKNIDNSIENIIITIKKLIQLHNQQKGIIHVSSHKIAELIFKRVQSNRLLIVSDFKDRNDMLNYHFNTSKHTILMSPSLMQGVDLINEFSRFQIIAKVPFLNLGDKYIVVKKGLVKKWYQYQTAKLLQQSYGRSCRSNTDYCYTYILDSDFTFFYKMNQKLFANYFKEAVIKGKLK